MEIFTLILGWVFGFLSAWVVALIYSAWQFRKDKVFANEMLGQINQAMIPKSIGKKEPKEAEKNGD